MIHTIYIEDEIREHPRTKEILARFEKAERVSIERYGEVFNRRAQNFRIQKQRPALILARKFDNWVLEAPEGYGIGANRNFYFSHLLNCLYDCRYCFLQGMYRSAHYLLFVNFEDFGETIRSTAAKHPEKTCTFFSGYDGDSLALDRVTGFSDSILPYFDNLANAELELRTKSVQINSLLKRPPQKGVVVAFSFTPDEISREVEHGVPPVASRIKALHRLAKEGWSIGLRFDPLIDHPEFEKLYARLFSSIFDGLSPEAVHSVSIGPLRFPKAMYQQIVKLHPRDRLLAESFESRAGMISYPQKREREMYAFCRSRLLQLVPESVYFSCTPEGL